MYINKGEIRVKKHILLCFLISGSLFLSDISAGAAETEARAGSNIVSEMTLAADGSYVQGSDVVNENYRQEGGSPTEIPLGSSLKAYFSFKGPSLKDFIEKVKVENDKLDYYRALFGFNISF
jgi:hypothetical protein